MYRYRCIIPAFAIVLLAGVLPAFAAGTNTSRTRAVQVRGDAYRVQLFVSTSRDEAEAVADRIRSQFPDQTVQVVFQTPFHKVRIGDFFSQRAAYQFLDQARDVGYAEGMIVPARGRVARRVAVRPPVVASAESVDEEPEIEIEPEPEPETPPQVYVLRRREAPTPVAAAETEGAATEKRSMTRTFIALTAGLAVVAVALLLI